MSLIVKRCSAAVVVALALLLPEADEMRTSQAGLELIAELEGCRLSPYRCSAGVWTNGIGHTAGVVPGKNITEREAAMNLVADIRRSERRLAQCMPVEMPQPVYDAVSSFAFNVGSGAACRSTLAHFINQKRWRDACEQLPRWVYVNGVVSQGLINRRSSELVLCLSGVK